MYGYSYACAAADVWHKVDYAAMLYPAYFTASKPLRPPLWCTGFKPPALGGKLESQAKQPVSSQATNMLLQLHNTSPLIGEALNVVYGLSTSQN